jgi:hypothetical protein
MARNPNPTHAKRPRRFEMKAGYWILLTLGALGIVALVVFGPNLRRHFGMRYADADREVHQRTLPYVRGAIEHVQQFKLDYDKAENEHHKESIRQMVLHQASTIDLAEFPPHLQSWIEQLRRQQ